MMTTDQKGGIAELAMAMAAIKLGVEVYRPMIEGGRYDMIFAPGEVDSFAPYCADVDRCYFLPYELLSGRSQIQLRLNATKNNQSAGVNWAKDYEFAATLGRPGAVAQLGERRAGSA